MKSPTTSTRDVAATRRTHVNARIGQAAECVAPRRIENAVTRCGAEIRLALSRTPCVYREKLENPYKSDAKREHHNELRIRELVKLYEFLLVDQT